MAEEASVEGAGSASEEGETTLSQQEDEQTVTKDFPETDSADTGTETVVETVGDGSGDMSLPLSSASSDRAVDSTAESGEEELKKKIRSVDELRAKLKKMNEEAQKICAMTSPTAAATATPTTATAVGQLSAMAPMAQYSEGDTYAPSAGRGAAVGEWTPESQRERDSRSIFVKNVDFETETSDLRSFFTPCGEVQTVTIPRDHYTKQPKGIAHVEFASAEAVVNALTMSGSEFRGQSLQIERKRTNISGFSRGGYRGRGRGRGYYRGGYYRGRGRGRGYYRGYHRGGYSGRGHYHPYGRGAHY